MFFVFGAPDGGLSVCVKNQNRKQARAIAPDEYIPAVIAAE